MKKQFQKLLMGFVCLTVLFSAKTVRAEDIPADLTSVFALIEPYLLSGGGVPVPGGVPAIPGATLNLGNCQPVVTPGFPTTTLHFTATITCPVNGNVYINLIPAGVSVRLEIVQGPIEKVEADFVIQIKRKASTTYVSWQMLNGYVSVRAQSGLPAQDFNMTGAGQRAMSKQLTTAKSRVNVFDAATTNGTALLKEMSKVKSASAAPTKSTVCSLYGASKTNVESGSLAACRELK